MCFPLHLKEKLPFLEKMQEKCSQLDQVWLEDTPHGRFWRRLLNDNVDKIVQNRKHLRALRFNNDLVKQYQKRLGHIFEERGLNLYQLIAESYDECWDSEDEEKSRPAPKKNVVSLELKEKNPDNDALRLDPAREIGVRSREKEEFRLQVRSGDERCESNLQEVLKV